MITVKDGEVDIGGNPSAEEQEEALEDGASRVNNVTHSFRLQATTFDKKSYLTYLKVGGISWSVPLLMFMQGYMKAVKGHLLEKNPERVEAFEKGAAAFAKKIVVNFKDYEFVRFFFLDKSGRSLECDDAVHRREHEPRRNGSVT